MLIHTHKHYAEKYKHSLMNMALSWANNSVAKRAKVGCVIYLNNNTLSIGFNGMPSGSDTEVCEVEQEIICYTDYPPTHDTLLVTKPEVIHSEINAISKVEDKSLLQDSIAFVTMAPCRQCAIELIKVGIAKVYYHEVYRCTEGLHLLTINNVEVEKL